MKRPLRWVVVAAAIAGVGYAALLGWVFRVSRLDERSAADAIVVMGAAQYDGTPSAALERRLRGAAELYRSGCAPVVVVSGGSRPGDRTSEGEAGLDWLVALGVPAAALRAETRATTSVENLRFAMDVAPEGRWLIVTDDLHALRSGIVAERLGIDAVTVGVRTTTDRARYALRESAAILAYRFGAFR